MKKINNICYVNTIYPLFLFLLLNNDKETFYFFGEDISKNIAKNFKNYKYLIKEYKNKGWRKNIEKYFFLKELYLFLKKNQLFNKKIYLQDHLRFSDFFLNNIENCYLLEDGFMNYNEVLLEKENKKIIKSNKFLELKNIFLKKIKSNKKSLGLSEEIKKIYLTGILPIPNLIKNKVEIVNIEEKWNNLEEINKEEILSYFNISLKNMKILDNIKDKILLITQPLSEDKFITEEEKIKLYKEILEKYNLKNVIIKPHPREKTDYKKIFNEVNVLEKNFPIEILSLLGINFYEVVTLFSTAALNLKGRSNINFIGTNNNIEIEKTFGKIEGEYYKKEE